MIKYNSEDDSWYFEDMDYNEIRAGRSCLDGHYTADELNEIANEMIKLEIKLRKKSLIK